MTIVVNSQEASEVTHFSEHIIWNDAVSDGKVLPSEEERPHPSAELHKREELGCSPHRIGIFAVIPLPSQQFGRAKYDRVYFLTYGTLAWMSQTVLWVPL